MALQQGRNYELVMVLSPETNEEEAANTVSRVRQLLEERGGSITHHEAWGTKQLAYPIRRFREGNYLLTRFTAGPAAVLELERSLRTAENVLRHLVTRT